MAGYSKDMERQNKALKDLMTTGKHEKDYVQVGYEGKEKNLGGKTREGKMTEICKKAMKKKLDTKFWRTNGHCFDCHIEMENKLRINGEYENYAKKKINENKKSYLKDLKQSIEEFEATEGKAEFFNQVGVNSPELEKEKWDMGKEQFDKQMNDAREYIQSLEEAIEDEQQEIAST